MQRTGQVKQQCDNALELPLTGQQQRVSQITVCDLEKIKIGVVGTVGVVCGRAFYLI
jgi:hypothetical protein